MKKIITITTLLILSMIVRAQDPAKHLRPETPTVAQFMRFDDISVSEYTGSPDISVPLYTISEDGVDIPIVLTYNAGGIKVNQQASWIGLGWDLHLGSLVQIINDEDDLGSSYHNMEVVKMIPDYPEQIKNGTCYEPFPMRYVFPLGTANVGWTPTYPTYSPRKEHVFKTVVDYYVPVKGDFTTRREGLFNDNNLLHDSEPDIFKINFLGTNISFVLDWKTNQFVALNKKGYKIVRKNDNWIITDPHGVNFHFGFKSSTVSQPVHDRRRYSLNTWFLNRIVTKNGKEIVIDYEQTELQSMPMALHVVGKNKIKLGTLPMETLANKFLSFPLLVYREITSASNSWEKYTFIKSITMPKGSVNFSMMSRTDIPASKRMSSMIVKNKIGQTVKSVSLTHDYFVQTDGKRRLKLLSIKDNDMLYNFSYDETYKLPPLDSKSQDCWGYFNGHNNSSLVPNALRYCIPNFGNDDFKKNNLSANLPYTKTATLTGITYPSGGKVKFDYELHTFNNYPYRVPDYNETSLSHNYGESKGHGLRIKTVTHEDRDGSEVKKTQYSYIGGKAILPKLFFRKLKYVDVEKLSDIKAGTGVMEESTVNGYTIFNPLSSFDGVGYTHVTRNIIGTGISANERIETMYHNNPDITAFSCLRADALVPVPAYKDHTKPANGSISSRKWFNSDNKLIKEEKYNYRMVVSPTYYGARLSKYDFLVVWDFHVQMPYERNMIGYYPIFDVETLMTRKDEIDYSGETPIVVTQNFGYDALGRLLTESKAGRSISYTYPTSATDVGKKMIAVNRIADVFTKTFRTYDATIVYYTKNDYLWDNTAGKPLLASSEERKQSYYPIINKVSYEKYDLNNNLVQVKGMDGVPITYLWGYERQYPIAEIRNATYEAVISKLGSSVISALETSIEPSATHLTSLNNLRNSMPDTQIQTFTYKPLVGITSMTDEKGITTNFGYDDFGRLKTVKDRQNNIFRNHIYHVGANVDLLNMELKQPIIQYQFKQGDETYISFIVKDVNPPPSIYLRIYCENTGKSDRRYGDYSGGKRSMGKLIKGYVYHVYVGFPFGPESKPLIFTAS